MCGIAGFIGTGTRSDLEKMTAGLAHRGPDGEGFFVEPERRVHLGHRRLAIIDLGGGAQPMANDDKSSIIVFNGEIYNHKALRGELIGLGQRFTSDHSDTEVIVRGYDQWGETVVERLEGMFAFALFNARRGEILLARDRFGEKPLFYVHASGNLAFSSEIHSLRQHPIARALALDSLALQKLFAHSFLPGDVTPYSGMRKLLPGSYAVFNLRNGTLRQHRYWRFQIANDPPAGGEKAWIEELRELLRSSVVSRLESDVPIGIFLSGGIDSSTIAALAAAEVGRDRISTFTIGFNEDSYDERGYAAVMAARLGSAHHVEVCDAEFMRAQSREILAKSGELLGDPSLIPTSLLAAGTARHVKVALSGDGGDELFGGYDPFLALGKARLYHQLVPKPVHAALRGLAGLMPVATTNMSLDFKINRALRGLSFNPKLWNPVWLAPLEPDDIASAFTARYDVEEIYSEAIALWDGAPELSDIDHTLEFYSNIYLPDNILVKSDRAGMMHGLEIRAPFLSLEIADFARRLPAHTKVRGGTTKWILKEAVRSLLPAEIIDRPKKGFGLPIAQWLRETPFKSEQTVAGLNDSVFDVWAKEHSTSQRDYRGALWCRRVLDTFLAGRSDNAQPDVLKGLG